MFLKFACAKWLVYNTKINGLKIEKTSNNKENNK